MGGRHIVYGQKKKKKKNTTTTNTKSKDNGKVVTRMTSHSLDGPKDRKPLVVALFYGKFAGPVTRIDLDLSSYDMVE